MSKDKITYRLYALNINSTNIATAGGERFHRITADYVLIYTDKEQPCDSVEITADESKRLTERDKEWLFDCNMVIINEHTAKHSHDIVKNLNDKVSQLEEALAKEKEKLDGRKNKSNN